MGGPSFQSKSALTTAVLMDGVIYCIRDPNIRRIANNIGRHMKVVARHSRLSTRSGFLGASDFDVRQARRDGPMGADLAGTRLAGDLRTR